ncbi:MAG: hypothetical protein LBM70_04265 [Victivallales bacterium]|jgi:16S rRNA A1518/A1519 N6-dimethyltransferase RsmA/KsgA/DIM1 with predicted DNA glycosylase/AP lyase activity|nr:hypothetical protein [Victivallales bacterium]
MTTVNRQSRQVEYGDYQTPVDFAHLVCNKLREFYSLAPATVIEPTMGTGNFIDSAMSSFNMAHAFYGIEINPTYYANAQSRLSDQNNVTLYNADIFSFDFSKIKECIDPSDELLILGNPPWVTNSQLSTLNSNNVPSKGNFKGYSGLDAITGKGNFDVAEYIILQLLSEFAKYKCTLAMLCKTIVAKNIIRDMNRYNFQISSADMFVFNATEIFNVNCDAALFVVQLGKKRSFLCNVYDFHTNETIRQFGWENGLFYSNICDRVNQIEGVSQFEWRQGVKHDCAKVMELSPIGNNSFRNNLGETVKLSVGEYVFPLFKSSDIKSYEICNSRKYVIIPQCQVNAETSVIESKDNDVWQYLVSHENLLNARRSIIYKNAPKFSIFGIGDYSFTKYKVGISGFYKEPIFALIYSNYPVMLDDTCYFIGFNEIVDAIIVTALLNHPLCTSFLKSIAFLDSKRPYTKEVLQRIDICKLTHCVNFDYIAQFAEKLGQGYSLKPEEYLIFKDKISHEDACQLKLFA